MLFIYTGCAWILLIRILLISILRQEKFYTIIIKEGACIFIFYFNFLNWYSNRSSWKNLSNKNKEKRKIKVNDCNRFVDEYICVCFVIQNSK